jgi:hypothetical protein
MFIAHEWVPPVKTKIGYSTIFPFGYDHVNRDLLLLKRCWSKKESHYGSLAYAAA